MKALLPGDVKLREFGRRFRGLDPAEVALFLAEVAAHWDEAERQRVAGEQKLAALEAEVKQLRELEPAARRALLEAEETARKTVDAARREAELVAREAGLEAGRMLEKAREDLTALREELLLLRTKKDSLVSRLNMFLQSELETVRALESDEAFLRPPGAAPAASRQDDSGDRNEKAEIDEILKTLDHETKDAPNSEPPTQAAHDEKSPPPGE